MRADRSVRLRRVGLAAGQAAVAVLAIGGVAWAGTQPVVTDRVAALDLVREREVGQPPGPTVVALEQAALVCPGPELVGLAGAREVPLETTGTAVAAPLAVLGDIPAPEGVAALALTPLTPAADDSSGAASGDETAPELPEVLTATFGAPGAYLALGSGAAAPAFVATQETRADTEELVGLASVPCQGAQPSGWVLGGGGGPGRAERLVLTNAGSNAVTVDVTAYGVAGTTAPPDGQGIVVPAQGRVVLLGDALAPEEAQPAFQVVADGGDITAVLVETSISGTLPTGFDVVPVTAGPAQVQVIPGVEVPTEGGGTLIVRVVNPGETEAIGAVAALTEAGERPIPEAVVRVPAGSVVDVPIEGLPAGATTLTVSADIPVVAAARTFINNAGIDSAWAVGQGPVVGIGAAALPTREGVQRTLVLSARGGDATVEVVEVSGGEASSAEVLISTDGSVSVPLSGDGVWVRLAEGEGALYGAVLTTGADGTAVGVSSMPLTSPPVSARRSEVVPLG